MRLVELADAVWAESLGCATGLLRTPGAHLVPGGAGFAGYDAVYMVRLDLTTLVYCPEPLRPVAQAVLDDTPADEVFTARTCERIAQGRAGSVHGPAWHGFVDDEHLRAASRPEGGRLHLDDDRLAHLRRACGDDEWTEGGFVFDHGLLYGVEMDGQLVAAGNMTPFRGRLADVGLITRPSHRGRGVAGRLASRMIADALPEAGVVRYRSRTANAASLAVARALGFVGRGENIVARLGPG
ncbi:MAG: GNAT family N-acetyltransferase [Acidimicrobiales bacterium]